MLRVVTLSVALLSLSLGCSRPAARREPAALDAGGDMPTLCQAVARAGGRCSPDGVPTFEGAVQPRVELLTECEAAAKLHRPCSEPGGFVLEIEY